MDNAKFLTRCLQLANYARGYTSPNPLVGAIVVHDNKIIGEGYHHRAGQPHAEVMAIKSVKNPSLLSESTVYCSLEPCSHFGKTPPCSHLLVEKKIRKVVIGCLDTNPEVSGKGVHYLEKHGIQVELAPDPTPFIELNRVFFTNMKENRPYITLKFAQSADGFIDADRGLRMGPTQISGPITSCYTHRLRAQHDGIVVTAKTAMLDQPRLNLRHFSGNPPRPILLIGEKYIPDFELLKSFEIPPLLISQKQVDGFDCIHKDPKHIEQWLPELLNWGITSIIVEGGSLLLASFMQTNLVDEVHRYTSPILLEAGTKAPAFEKDFQHQNRLCDDVLEVYHGSL